MPERQSSPGEVTPRPATDGIDDGNAQHPAADVQADPPPSDAAAGAPPVVAEAAPPEEPEEPAGPAAPDGKSAPADEPAADDSPTVSTVLPKPPQAAADVDATTVSVSAKAAATPASERPTVPVRTDGAADRGNAWFGSWDNEATQVIPLAGATTTATVSPPQAPAPEKRPTPATPAPASGPQPAPKQAAPKQPGPKQPGPKPPAPKPAPAAPKPAPVAAAAPAAPPQEPAPAPATPPGPAPAPAAPKAAAAAGTSRPTVVIPAYVTADPPTERFAVSAPAGPPPPDRPTGPGDGPGDGASAAPRRSRLKRTLLIGAGVVVACGLLYGGDLLLGSGSVPRGVTVVGVPVGGLSLAAAEEKLRAQLTSRTTSPVPVTAGVATSNIDPHQAGLTLDWRGTVTRAGEQPLNPLTRLRSFFEQREVGTVTTVDRPALESALSQLAPIVDTAPAEGTVRFEGTTAKPVDPVPGHKLDVPAGAAILQREWVAGGTVALPLITLPPVTTAADVAKALDTVARPAVSGPVVVVGEKDVRGTLNPETIAAALNFRAAPGGGLVPELNHAALGEALKPQMAASEQPGSDAKIDFSSGNPVIVPSKDGRGVDYEATAKAMVPVLTNLGSRQVTAVYGDQHPELTTEKLTALGITGVIGEWTTGGFSADSGRNIKQAADKINGTIVQPGATFSLNEATNPRDAAHGYVEAGIIQDGHPSRGVGGGVSQVATTLYNASYFAGMVNVEHKEHSFYIGRYPAGREATVFDNVIDLKFRNDNPTGILIQTIWTPTSLTVKIYGTKRYEVTSTPGARTNPTTPNTITIPAGKPCIASTGAPGFTITDTRTLKEITTGEVRNETRTVRYDPSPNVICGQ